MKIVGIVQRHHVKSAANISPNSSVYNEPLGIKKKDDWPINLDFDSSCFLPPLPSEV